jgi:hypothetical protein
VRDRYFNDAEDRVGEVADGRATVWRWRAAFQNDFAARMDWCVQARRTAANHAPAAVMNANRGTGAVRLRVRSGSRVRLTAHGSADPDGDVLSYRWFHYPEAGGGQEAIDLGAADGPLLAFNAPGSATEIHIILQVTDAGTPALTAYRRAIVTVLPQ